MKSKRHIKIMELVENEDIHTQDELTTRLEEEGIEVTQATVSRDIKQLGLIKVPIEGGGYKYYLPPQPKEKVNVTSRMKRMFEDSVIDINFSENLVVINTLPGTAQAIAALLDNTTWDNVIGTIAGDDTILMVVKPKNAVESVIDKLENLTV
ncbi:arginine repressor [Orenia marismortui]|uniref:arginine repressor n=1 Tax=Orenia marismortui TaxID=46469 RepID=UPI00036BDA61|nr:arginine repressor [Orenia marismortui]